MMGNPADIAMQKLSEFFANDPLLRDVIHPNLPTPKPSKLLRPPTDILHSDGAVYVSMELPGLQKDDLHITAEGGRMKVWGEMKQSQKNPGKRTRSERHYGTFKREFAIPNSVDRDGIDASLEEGVLTITLPLKPDNDKRVIKVS
jgi:HSP20 family protein